MSEGGIGSVEQSSINIKTGNSETKSNFSERTPGPESNSVKSALELDNQNLTKNRQSMVEEVNGDSVQQLNRKLEEEKRLDETGEQKIIKNDANEKQPKVKKSKKSFFQKIKEKAIKNPFVAYALGGIIGLMMRLNYLRDHPTLLQELEKEDKKKHK
jgi:hypothetical protein